MISDELTYRDVSDIRLPNEIAQIFMTGALRIKRSIGQNIITQSDNTQDVFYIHSGSVEISIQAPNAKEFIFREMGAGSIIGELSAIDGEKRSLTVCALEDTVLYKVSPKYFLSLVETNREFSWWLTNSLVKRVRNTSEKVFELSSMNVRCRIILDIIRRSYSSGVDNDQSTFRPPRDQKKVATKLGTHREAVNREYSALVKEGLILKTSEAVVVPSVNALEALLSRMMGH